jgi:predicted nucleic-acid-binding protein
VIALDTNVLVRFLVADEPDQTVRATRLIGSLSDEEPGFVGREVMVELVWVLERAYSYSRDEIAGAVEGLLGAREIRIEEAQRVGRAADRYRQGGAGFSDQMVWLAADAAGCDSVATFDRRAARIEGGRLL